MGFSILQALILLIQQDSSVQKQMDTIENLGVVALTGLFIWMGWLTIIWVKSSAEVTRHTIILEHMGEDLREMKSDLKTFLKKEMFKE